jgi:16S rRNA (cytidine1402-2'-O)-methyltransferase
VPLYVVAVPLGNLEDITLRARRLLSEADVIACEDTRRTGRLLELLGLPKRPLLSVHEHNEAERIPGLLARLEAGESVALVSDAGTPAISDPGFRVVRAAIEAGYEVVPVPGPSAVITALCASGLPTDRFRFVGFPPQKAGPRRKWLEALAGAEETLVLYVSPHQLAELLGEAAAAFGADRPAVVARELTKRFEEFRRSTLGALAADPGVVRGEVVLLVGGAPPEAAPEAGELAAVVQALLDEGYAPAKAAREAARRTGASRDEAYRTAVALRGGGPDEE